MKAGIARAGIIGDEILRCPFDILDGDARHSVGGTGMRRHWTFSMDDDAPIQGTTFHGLRRIEPRIRRVEGCMMKAIQATGA